LPATEESQETEATRSVQLLLDKPIDSYGDG
jgi:hypothetical protein